jgi:hypothetical protein
MQYEDVALRWIGRYELGLESQLTTKRQGFGLLSQESIRSGVENEIVETLCPNRPSQPFLLLQQEEVHRTAGKRIRAGESTYTPAYDENLRLLHDST